MSRLLPSRRNCWSRAPPLRVHRCAALSCKPRRRAGDHRLGEPSARPSGSINQRQGAFGRYRKGAFRRYRRQQEVLSDKAPRHMLRDSGNPRRPYLTIGVGAPRRWSWGSRPEKEGAQLIIRWFRERMSLVSSCFCPFQLCWFIILCWELMPSRVSCWFYCSSNRALLLYSLR